eukprot:2942191-Rhodomonas_salina.1
MAASRITGCANVAAAEWMCFWFDEQSEQFMPWGVNGDLGDGEGSGVAHKGACLASFCRNLANRTYQTSGNPSDWVAAGSEGRNDGLGEKLGSNLRPR